MIQKLAALSLFTLLVLGAPGTAPVLGQAALDPNLPVYRPVTSAR